MLLASARMHHTLSLFVSYSDLPAFFRNPESTPAAGVGSWAGFSLNVVMDLRNAHVELCSHVMS